jgi:ribosomal protein L40E
MFCPNCGAESPSAEVYCKRCGEWLPNLKSKKVKWGGETPEQHLTVMLFLNSFSAIAAFFSAIILYATHLGNGMNWSVALTAALCLSISAWQLSTFIIGLKLRRRLKRGRAGQQSQTVLDERQTQPALNAADTSQFIGARSVTENTTELLTPLPNQARERKN